MPKGVVNYCQEEQMPERASSGGITHLLLPYTFEAKENDGGKKT